MEKFLNRKIIYEGKVLRLEVDKVACKGGITSYREIIRHHGGAAILCIFNKKVLLIKQYRYAYQEDIYEIPAGKLEASEDPYKAAMRELEEETGFIAKDMTELMTIYPTVGYSDEKIYIFLATEFEKTSTHFDEDEEIETSFYDLTEAMQMIQTGQIKDAKTICALQAYMLNQKSSN